MLTSESVRRYTGYMPYYPYSRESGSAGTAGLTETDYGQYCGNIAAADSDAVVLVHTEVLLLLVMVPYRHYFCTQDQ